LHILSMRKRWWHIKMRLEILLNHTWIIICKWVVTKLWRWLSISLGIAFIIIFTQLLVNYIKICLSSIHLLLAKTRLWLLMQTSCTTFKLLCLEFSEKLDQKEHQLNLNTIFWLLIKLVLIFFCILCSLHQLSHKMSS